MTLVLTHLKLATRAADMKVCPLPRPGGCWAASWAQSVPAIFLNVERVCLSSRMAIAPSAIPHYPENTNDIASLLYGQSQLSVVLCTITDRPADMS